MYPHRDIEPKWQSYWRTHQTFHTIESPDRPPYFVLDMFPYPSGAGLHVGHVKGYTATDIISRYRRACGYSVLHPMGWDAFGLPAENYAIKTGTHPRITTEANIKTFKAQIDSLGLSYDWDREVDTTDPEYYRWTQWIFLKLWEKGLAYEAEMPVWWCPHLRAVLANEEVVNGKSEVGGHPVERRTLRQWVLRITEYADTLLADLDGLDWPEGIKEMQRNWIGRSEGCEFKLAKVEKKTVLVLHGWDGSSTKGWIPWLRETLEKLGYTVIVPDLPHSGTPDLAEQLAFLGQYDNQIDENTIIIGHSLGAHLAAHYITQKKKKIAKLICVGPVYNGLYREVDLSSEPGGTEAMHYFAQPFDESILSSLDTPVVAYLSRTDPYIPYESAHAFYTSMGAAIRSFDDRWHFNEDAGIFTLPELLDDVTETISVYTTRVDTVYSMAFVVIAPDHPHVADYITSEQRDACTQYIEASRSRSDIDRTETKEKTGVFTGSYLVNPYNDEKVPLWIGDFVLGTYGTGCIFGDAHDERDLVFAKKYSIPLKLSVRPDRDAGYMVIEKSLPSECIDTLKDFGSVAVERTDDEWGRFFRVTVPTAREPEFIRFLENNLLSDGSNATNGGWYTDSIGTTNVLVFPGKHFQAWDDTALRAFKEHGVSIGITPSQLDIDLFKTSFTDDGILVHSGEYDGLTSAEARKTLTEKAEKEGFGKKKVNYKLRDWIFSRQRYWGEPIPLIHLKKEDVESLPKLKSSSSPQEKDTAYTYEQADGWYLTVGQFHTKIDTKSGVATYIIGDYDLPLRLPEVERYEPSGDGRSPLSTLPDWTRVRLASNLTGERETNTMPQWGGSCWYYLRFMDPKNQDALASQERMKYWGMVDEYVGGAEHAVLHLLYARFWHHVLYDIGAVPTREPFTKLRNVGLILGPNGEKMSKSRGNVINPNEIVEAQGADTLRLYEMFMSDFRDSAAWDPNAIIGMRRLVEKIFNLYERAVSLATDDTIAMKTLHKTIKKVGEDISAYKFNTAISAIQILANGGLPRDEALRREWREKLAIIFAPFAPHLAEETWSMLGHTESISLSPWPSYDPAMTIDDTVTIAVQIDGKLRSTHTCARDCDREELLAAVHTLPEVLKWIADREIVREIIVPNKLVNIVTKEK